MQVPGISKKYQPLSIHVLAWLIFIFFGTLNRLALNPSSKIGLLDILLTHLPSIYVFYGSSLIFFRILGRKKYFLLLPAVIVFFLSYALLVYVIGYIIAPAVYPGTHRSVFHLGHFFIECFWIYFLYSFFSLGYFFAMQTIQREKQLRIAREKDLRIEQDRLVAEYSFLRSQINPHFLHNMLNFLYAKSLGSSQELSEGILTLSEVMRYSLEDGYAKNGSVLLLREVENLKKVIKINQLRFSNKLNISFSITGNIDHFRIIPLVLITLVENALKHGELSNPDYPVLIRLELTEQERESRLLFSVSNRKKTGPKELGYGIGMDNVKKRLEYTYHGKHYLTVKEEKDFYTVELLVKVPVEEQVNFAWEPLKQEL